MLFALQLLKPEDIIKHQKFLHLPVGSVLIPFLQTNANPILSQLYGDTEAGNKVYKNRKEY